MTPASRLALVLLLLAPLAATPAAEPPAQTDTPGSAPSGAQSREAPDDEGPQPAREEATAAERRPDASESFVPSEQVRPGAAVAFPADI